MNGDKGSPTPKSEPLSDIPADLDTLGSPDQQFAYSRTRLRQEPVRQLRKPKGLAPLIDDSEVPEDTQDHWLDHISTNEAANKLNFWNVLYDSFAVPIHWSRQLFTYIATTPGKMLALTAILSVAIFAAGYSMSQSADQRQGALDVLLSTTEPMSYSAHNLYTSLSLADTIATTGFVQAGVESSDTRSRYNAAIDRASVAASESAASIPATDAHSMRLITDIQRQLPVYTGMVESARVNNRVGNPVGVAYMAEASSLMRETILPAASELFTLTSTRVSEAQRNLTLPQWVPLSGLFAAVSFLSIAQWWLWRLTHRRLNKGFLAATALMLTAILWVSASNFATWQAGNRGFAEAAMPWDSLTASRIMAQQTRTAETLVLVRRQSLAQTQSTFDETVDSITVALDDFAQAEGHTDQSHNDRVLDQAREALLHWENSHQGLGTALNNGDYEKAIILSTGTPEQNGGSPTSSSSYAALDSALSALISDARASMRAFINDGLAATKLVSTVVLLLSLAAIIAVWLGIRPRLREYL
ncbi:hypothetical protein [Corynebacterium sp. A21]|uniref:hypothetical protein n=1 Tax=Corynebacterium sp. A21 TaxID=3457318 RepID=UPI003FD0532B